MYPVLASCAFDRASTPEEIEDDKIERFYKSTVRSTKESQAHPLYVAICEFSAGQKLKDIKLLEIQATYFIAFRYDDESISDADKRHLWTEMAESTAWPLFRDLFIHVGSQSGEQLPTLPTTPNIKWRDSEVKLTEDDTS